MGVGTKFTMNALQVPTAYSTYPVTGSDASTTLDSSQASDEVYDVWGYDLWAVGATTVNFKSGATDRSGDLVVPQAGNLWWQPPVGSRLQQQNALPRVQTIAGGNLVLTNSNAVGLTGVVWANKRKANLNI